MPGRICPSGKETQNNIQELDITDPDFGLPVYYNVMLGTQGTVQVHKSRLIIIQGEYNSHTSFIYNNYSAYGILGSLQKTLKDWQAINQLVLPMVTRASICLLYTSPSPRDRQKSRMPSSA